MAQGYIYDPSKDIKQSFQSATKGVTDVFGHILAQKQRDFALAEDAFTKIEDLKKNLNRFGQKQVTDQANSVLKEVSSMIKENGKLDYNQLGQIRQKISNIRDVKNYYDQVPEMYKEYLNLGVQNKDSLTSFENFFSKLNTTIQRPDLVGNPDALQKEMANLYTNSLDAQTLVDKTYAKLRKPEDFSLQDYDKKGNLVSYQGKNIPSGWRLDAKTGKWNPPMVEVKDANGNPVINPTTGLPEKMDYVQEYLNYLKTSSPETLEILRKKSPIVASMDNQGDYAIAKHYLDNIPKNVGIKIDKTSDELRGAKAKATEAEVEAKYAEQKAKAGIARDWAYVNKANNMGEGIDVTQVEDGLSKFRLKTTTGKSIPMTGYDIGKNLKVNIGDKQILVNGVAKSGKSGDIWVQALVDKSGQLVLDENNLQGASLTWRKVPNASEFKKSLINTIDAGGINAKQRPKTKAFLEGVFGAQSENLSSKKGQATVKTSQEETKSVLNSEVEQFAKEKGYDVKEYTDYLKAQGYTIRNK